MNIFSTFLNIAKKETTGRSGIKGLIKDMHQDVVSYRKEKQSSDSPSVSEDFLPEDFQSAYKNLQITTGISFSFISFMAAYIFTSEDFIGLFSIGAFLVIGLFWHFSFVIRAYRARVIFENWGKRQDPFSVSAEEVLENALANPKILLPFLCPLPVLNARKCDNINKKKGFKGDKNEKAK